MLRIACALFGHLWWPWDNHLVCLRCGKEWPEVDKTLPRARLLKP